MGGWVSDPFSKFHSFLFSGWFLFYRKIDFFIVKKNRRKIDFSSPEKTRKKSGKARGNYRKNPCIFLAKYEKYLTERVLPSFRVCLKNDRKSLNDAFGGEFPSDARIRND